MWDTKIALFVPKMIFVRFNLSRFDYSNNLKPIDLKFLVYMKIDKLNKCTKLNLNLLDNFRENRSGIPKLSFSFQKFVLSNLIIRDWIFETVCNRLI